MSENTRGRQPGFVMSPEHRTKIANSQLLNRLLDFFEGREGVELTQGQITVGLGLLKKVLPDLQSTTIDGTLSLNPLAELLKEIDGRSRGIPES